MYTVVVADDEEELRKAIIRKVDWESIGFQVIGEAENGIEALELVEKKEPDLLLTDIRMPFVSGIELARQVREIRPTTQIAFLSGFDEFSYAQQAIQYNIISYLLKPISMRDLTEELKNIKKKIDHIFEEFDLRKQEKTYIHEFVLPLLLDSYGKPDHPHREEQLLEQAEIELDLDELDAETLAESKVDFIYLNWPETQHNLEVALLELTERYQLPIIVGDFSSKYRQNIQAVARALSQKATVVGYFPQVFNGGLVAVASDLTRQKTAAYNDYQDIIFNNGLEI